MYFIQLYFLVVISAKGRQKSKFFTNLSINIYFLAYSLSKQFLISSVSTLSWIFLLRYLVSFVEISSNSQKFAIFGWNFLSLCRKKNYARDALRNFKQIPSDYLENDFEGRVTVIKIIYSSKKKIRYGRYFRIVHWKHGFISPHFLAIWRLKSITE